MGTLRRGIFTGPPAFSMVGCREPVGDAQVRRAMLLLSVSLLGGCAGYAADYWKPKEKLLAPQLTRYGLSAEGAQCVHKRLTETLSVWQLRQLSDWAERLNPGGPNVATLAPRDLAYAAGLAKDPKVGVETRRALDACNAAPPPPPPPPPPAQIGGNPPNTAPSAAAAPAPPPLWFNLGAAKTGQGIAVDASNVVTGPSWRQAWFRLINSDQPGVGDVAYLLRIDCSARTIMALGGRKYTPAGSMTEQKDYPTPEGPLAIEPGTVMEIAYRAFCA
jgi:hypothetical protein